MTFVELVETPTLSLLKRGRRRPFDPSTSSGTKSAGSRLGFCDSPSRASDCAFKQACALTSDYLVAA